MKANLPPRRLVPRWRRTQAVLDMPEATFSRSASTHKIGLDRARLDDAIHEWKLAPTAGLLGDILSYSIDDSLRAEIIRLVREDPKTRNVATVTQAEFIGQMLDDEGQQTPVDEVSGPQNTLEICNQDVRQTVSSLRRMLRVNPADSLALLDLAQFQLSSGHVKRAERSVQSALSLSPNSRLALRTAARFYVHRLDFDKAHALITRHPRTALDPWLMASEIALADAADTPSRFATKGFKFVRDEMAAVPHLLELAGALGSAELKAGNVKRAREMFRLALKAPNDNVAAQAITLRQQLGIDPTISQKLDSVFPAREAKTLLAWNTHDFELAALHALAWHEEEPFSSRPLNFLTTYYAATRDYLRAAILARRGLIADPQDPSLLANLAYALTCQGQSRAAERVLLKLTASKDPRYVGIAAATAGLMMMQQGSFDEGRRLYEAAMRIFRERQEFDIEALCCAYFARSAAETGDPERDAIALRAKDLYKKRPNPDTAIVLRSLDHNVELPVKQETGDRLSHWEFDSKTESLIHVSAFTPESTPSLIVRK